MMSLAKTIDVPGDNDGIYTIPVKHADATQLATKINEILGITAGGGGGAGRRRSGARPAKRGAAAGDEVAARCRRRSSSTSARTR